MAARLSVVCLTSGENASYRLVADAMKQGIKRCGDSAVIADHKGALPQADVAVSYGFKRHATLRKFPQFVYADLGYWRRKTAYRVAANDWSAHHKMGRGMPVDRLQALGLDIKPWRQDGREIVIAGSTRKASVDHGLGYMEWETRTARLLTGCGRPVMYRPKPTDPEKRPIPGIGYDERSMKEAMVSAYAVVTHHSNVAIDALVAGVPVHCETGAAAAFSVPIEQIANAPLMSGREQFLADVAWLEWTPDEMRSGACWSYLREHCLR